MIGRFFSFGEAGLGQIMTTEEVAKYLKLHEITISKYATKGTIPGIRIGRVWRFDKETIDRWIAGGTKEQKPDAGSQRKGTKEQSGKMKSKKPKV